MNLAPTLRDESGIEILPTRSELFQLRHGDYVRLMLTSGENFWAKINGNRRDNGTFTATIETKPKPKSPVKPGGLVVFEPEHVLEIL